MGKILAKLLVYFFVSTNVYCDRQQVLYRVNSSITLFCDLIFLFIFCSSCEG